MLALRNARMYLWYENGSRSLEPVDGVFEGLMDPGAVEPAQDAVYYLCGPLPFMQSVRGRLLDAGVAARDIRYEVFGPDLWQADLD